MGRLWATTADGKRRPTAEGYKEMYRKFQSSSKAKAERAARNKARRAALRKGTVHKGDNKEVDHIKGLSEGGSKSLSNTRVVSREYNRSRHQASRRRGSRRNRSTWGK